MKTVSRILLAILTLVVLIVSCSRNGSETESNEKSASETVIESGFNKLTVDEYKALVNSHELVLVDFFATWCGPCKEMEPHMKALKENYGNNVKVVKIDVDRNVEIAKELRITGMPTLKGYVNGMEEHHSMGGLNLAQLRKIVDDLKDKQG